MPLFVASSSMVMQTPVSSVTQPDIKDIEKAVNRSLKKEVEVLVKKCDQSVSKSEHGNKKIDDVIRRLTALERNHNNQVNGVNQVRYPQRPASLAAPPVVNPNPSAPVPSHTNLEKQPQQSGAPISTSTWAEVTARNVPPQQTTLGSMHQNVVEPAGPHLQQDSLAIQPTHRPNWKDRLHLLEGTAKISGQVALSADIDLVASNVGKNVSAVDLGNWLTQRGLEIKNCQLLTKSDEAKSLAYKITIAPQHFEKATKDANLWPERVLLRKFQPFSKSKTEPKNKTRGNHQRRPGYYNGIYQGWRDGLPTYQW